MSKKGKAAVTELVEQMKSATTVKEVEDLARKAQAFVTFAEMDEKKARISKAEGQVLGDHIENVKLARLKELPTPGN